MKPILKCGLLFSMLAMAGCGGGPRLDASSPEAYDASMKAMTADMSDAQKRQLSKDIMAALGPEAVDAQMKTTFGKDKAEGNKAELYKPLQGMNVEQIRAQADANRMKGKK